MTELNQFAISKALGSTIKDIGPVGFGNFNLRATTAEIQEALAKDAEPPTNSRFSYNDDAIVVKAFEDVRNGAPTDELLWNKNLAEAFVHQCKQLGLSVPHAYLVRRLMNVRKNAPRYKQHGIDIKPTTKKELHPSIVPQYAHVIEFALVRLRYRYGASIDDVLMDPALGDKFEELAKGIAPGLSDKDLRLGALYIRKNRVLKKNEVDKIEALDLSVLDKAWQGEISLARVDSRKIPPSPGLIELLEENRYLYISHNKDLQAAVSQLSTGDAFRLMANGFWTPDLGSIKLLFVPGEKVAGVHIGKWECKLVYERDPIFNWPMPKRVA